MIILAGNYSYSRSPQAQQNRPTAQKGDLPGDLMVSCFSSEKELSNISYITPRAQAVAAWHPVKKGVTIRIHTALKNKDLCIYHPWGSTDIPQY